MTFPIGDGGGFNIGKALKGGVEEGLKKAIDPLNLFDQGFGSKGASGLFPKGAGGGGGIEDILAALSKKDKNSSLDTSNTDGGLFSGGKDMGGGADAGGGQGGAGQGMQQAMGAIMNIVKAILPMILGFL